MSTAITPEVMGLETQILEDSPMTEAEQRSLVEVETRIKTALADKLERDLAIGKGLLQIFRERLYRSPKGGRKWGDYLKEESHKLTPDGQKIEEDTAYRLRGFYYFREEVLPRINPPTGGCTIPLPTSPRQVRPLLGYLDTLRRDPDKIDPRSASYEERRAVEAEAVEMWKAAVADAKGKVPTFDQVNRAALAYKANEANEARRLTDAQQAAQHKAVAASRAAVTTPVEPIGVAEPQAQRSYQPAPAPAPTIPAWELQKEDNALDATEECKKVSRAINEAHKAIGLLRGILYSQIHKYGRDYLGFLRQVDAGVYSLNAIDDQIQQMGEDIDFIASLLVADVGEGELAQATIDIHAIPTRA
jgi:hypothetical protein